MKARHKARHARLFGSTSSLQTSNVHLFEVCIQRQAPLSYRHSCTHVETICTLFTTGKNLANQQVAASVDGRLHVAAFCHVTERRALR